MIESEITKALSLITDDMNRFNKQITVMLRDGYSNPKLTSEYWNKLRKEIDDEYKKMAVKFEPWVGKTLPTQHAKEVKRAYDKLNKYKQISQTAAELAKPNALTKALTKDMLSDLVGSLENGRSNIARITRKTQQALLAESAVDKAVAEAIQSGNLMNAAYYKSKDISDTLASQLKSISTIVDNKHYVVAGGKKFKVNYYAEMVARVKFHESQSYAAMQTGVAFGTSLMQVSSHNTIYKACVPYEGKIFSVGGENKSFPKLVNMPPYHVNCIHTMLPIFQSALEVDGTLEGWQNFSEGKTNKPPYPKTFVPVSERSLA